MKNPTKKLALALLTLCTATHAQLTKAELNAKEKEMRTECAKIAKVVPCAVEVSGDVSLETAARAMSNYKAKVELGQAVKIFVSHAVTDTILIENGVAKQLIQISSKVSMDSVGLANAIILDQACGEHTDENGKKMYRAVSLAVLDPGLYEEAQKEIIPLTEPQSSSSTTTATTPSSTSTKQPLQPTPTADQQKTNYKQAAKKIATKAAKIIITAAMRFIGL